MKREYWRYLPVIFPYMRRYWLLQSISVVLLILGAAVALLEPWPLALLVDRVLSGREAPDFVTGLVGSDTTSLIWFAVVSGLIVTAAIHGVAVMSSYVATKIAQQITLDFRSDLFDHCQYLSQGYFDEHRTGDFMYKINFEAHAAGEMSVALAPLAQSLLTLIGMTVIVMRMDLTLAMVAVAVVPFVYWCSGYYGRKVEPRLLRTRHLESANLTLVNDAMTMLPVVSAFNRQKYEHRRFVKHGRETVEARIAVTVHQMLFEFAVALSTAVGVALVLGIGAQHVVRGEITGGELLVTLGYVRAVYDPLHAISHTLSHFQQHLMALNFAQTLFATKPEIRNRPNAGALPARSAFSPAVSFDRVSYTYPGREQTLDTISFWVREGSTVAIVGPTGAGKSTMLALLARFLDPDDGTVRINGVDIRDVSFESVRESVAFVHQQPKLFARSIAENIRYGRLDATDEEVVAAAQAADAHDFISRLPDGYGTMLGEEGARISGGERQRIAIARAFLKNAPILVLDEPTSSVDVRTESAILDALERLMVGRTTFIVAHRLSTVRNADLVLVLEQGRLIECGPPDELLRQNGLFAHLNTLQSEVGRRKRLAATVAGENDTEVDQIIRVLRKEFVDGSIPSSSLPAHPTRRA